MKPAKHKRCGTDVTIKRVHIRENETSTPHLWCPKCDEVVFEAEVTVKGPYCLVPHHSC